MRIDDNILLLIIGRLNKTNSAADDLALDAWLQQNDEHQQEYDHYLDLWLRSEGLSPMPPIDVNAQWERFQSKHFAIAEPKVYRLNVWRFAAAAVLLIGLFTSGIYYSGSNSYSTGMLESLTVSLNDGTEVILQENSELEIPRAYNWFSRNLKLNGVAYFDVAKNPDKPFEIEGSKASLRVLGTQFKMTSASEQKVEVTEGRVAYWINGKQDTIILTAGEKGLVDGDKLLETTIDNLNASSWKTGTFIFNNTPLKHVLSDLQSFYQFNIADPKDQLKNACAFSGSFKKESLPYVLEELSLVLGMDYELQNNQLKIKNVACTKP